MKTLKFAGTIGAVALAMGLSPAASAANTTGNLPVSASIAQKCTISSVGNLAFGTYDPVVTNATNPLTNTGSVAVKCTTGSTGITIDLDNGLNYSSGRRMVGATPTNFLSYSITQPNTTSTYGCPGTPNAVWGSAAGGSVYTPTVTWSSTSATTFSVCGSIPGGQTTAPIDTYSDTVVVTVTF